MRGYVDPSSIYMCVYARVRVLAYGVRIWGFHVCGVVYVEIN